MGAVQEYREVFGWIDAQADRMRDLVSKWVNINSFSYNTAGLQQLAQVLKKEWSTLGEVEELPLPPAESIDADGKIVHAPLGQALRIRKRPNAPRQIFLCIHMDTVYPPEGDFREVTLLDQNTMRGPGVCDAKGGLAVMLIAIEALERSPWSAKVGWEALINPDEEIGSPGSSQLFEEAAKRSHVGLLFEPAMPDGSLVSHRGGSGSYSVIVRGRSAHAGRDPHMGRNAIVAAAELSVALSKLTADGVTVNVSKIDGGGPTNVVPDLAICRFNVRAKTPPDQQKIQSQIKEVLSSFRDRDGIRMESHGGFHRPPKPLDRGTQRLQKQLESCAAEMGIPVSWRYSGGVSDGNQLAAAGLANLDSLGPRGGSIHSPDEFLLLDSLTERAKLATLLIRSLT
jgi:glutamate carboxypeptidase